MKNCLKGTAVLVAIVSCMILTTAAYAAKPDPDRYVVSFLDAAKGRSALRAAGADVLRELPNQGAVAAHIPARALKGLLRNPNIEYIEVDALRYPMSETVPWGIPTIQADLLNDSNTGSTMVCIIDSGYSNVIPAPIRAPAIRWRPLHFATTARTWPAPSPRSGAMARAWSASTRTIS